MPMVLRPSAKPNEAWGLIGPAYIPGAMKGEAVYCKTVEVDDLISQLIQSKHFY